MDDERVVEAQRHVPPRGRVGVTDEVLVSQRGAVVIDDTVRLDDQSVSDQCIDASDGGDRTLCAHGHAESPQPPAQQ